jgi:hypothetical protein
MGGGVMNTPWSEFDSEDRFIAGFLGLGCLGVLALILTVLGLTAWVIIRVTLHFT